MMTETIWTQDYDVNTLVLNPHKRLGLFGLLNLLQDMAWRHAERLGCGFEAMATRDTIWVLTRQTLTMNDWPAWGERVRIRTWPCPFERALAPRQFEILLGERKIGECVTQWLVMDSRSRRPLRANPADYPFQPRAEGLLALEAEKIQPLDGLPAAAGVEVRNSDLDVNGHVNNTRYAVWLLDSVPLATQAGLFVERYGVNFLAETHVGDKIAIESGPVEDGHWHFQGRREADAKVVFTARLRFRRRDSR